MLRELSFLPYAAWFYAAIWSWVAYWCITSDNSILPFDNTLSFDLFQSLIFSHFACRRFGKKIYLRIFDGSIFLAIEHRLSNDEDGGRINPESSSHMYFFSRFASSPAEKK